MTTTRQDAYIVAATRTPIGKAPHGVFCHTRPDDLLAHVIKQVLAPFPDLERHQIGDVITGCAMPEAQQGMNISRIGLLLAGLPHTIPGMTVNRFCSSGLQAVAMAADRIRLGEADLMLAAGVESMSAIPMMGNSPSINPAVFADGENRAIAYGMGITAEKVAERWQISRQDQDQFALQSHQRAAAAIEQQLFAQEISPFTVTTRQPDPAQPAAITTTELTVTQDEGVRFDTSEQALSRLKPAFARDGSVTAGNSSQMSDGAAAILLASERMIQRHQLKPLARFCGFSVAGVEPEIMGIGPTAAIPKVLKQTGLSLSHLQWIELNEAFAAQALAVIRSMDLDPARVNPLGGAIATGHPLGATGAIKTATLIHAMQRQQLNYGMVTMCIGTGMGAAGIFESIY